MSPALSQDIGADAPPASPGRAPRRELFGVPAAGVLLALAAGLLATALAVSWLRADLVAWLARTGAEYAKMFGEPMPPIPDPGLPLAGAVDFGVLAAALTLLAWLVGARTAHARCG